MAKIIIATDQSAVMVQLEFDTPRLSVHDTLEIKYWLDKAIQREKEFEAEVSQSADQS